MTTPELAGARWRKSSRSGTNSNCVEVAAVWRTSTQSGSNAACIEVAPVWRKSAYSGTNTACIEVVSGVGDVAVRDSKNPDGQVLIFNGTQWTAFLDAIKNGTFTPA